MRDKDKTKKQLINDLVIPWRQITELEESETERRRAEQELRKAKAFAESIIASAMDGIVVVDLEGRFIQFNAASLRMTGYSSEELRGASFRQFTPKKWLAEDEKQVKKLLRGIPHIYYEREFIRKDGSVFPVDISASLLTDDEGKPAAIMAIIRDETERKEMKERLLRQEKLAVLGQLAGGVSHELRNPLGAIKNAAYFLKMVQEDPEPEVKETLEILEKEVATCEHIISSLLDFVRPKPPMRRKVNIGDIVQEFMSRTMVPENIKVVSQLDETLPAILADPDQLGQAFGNIVLNAIQAMPEGGRLVIKSEAPGPGWVSISLADTGKGISKESLGKLFEPLFTSKAKGIGLGLTLAKDLVEKHGGAIEVKSAVGKGSTFMVRLPVSGKGE